MRGKVFCAYSRVSHSGITPAYAGKSCCIMFRHDFGSGSPPPMRGKVSFFVDTVIPKRITPAYAGKSFTVDHSPRRIQDHPRLCGEKSEPENCDMNNQGSPPPMRGKEVVHDQKDLHGGITPAYAGKSASYILNFVLL